MVLGIAVQNAFANFIENRGHGSHGHSFGYHNKCRGCGRTDNGVGKRRDSSSKWMNPTSQT